MRAKLEQQVYKSIHAHVQLKLTYNSAGYFFASSQWNLQKDRNKKYKRESLWERDCVRCNCLPYAQAHINSSWNTKQHSEGQNQWRKYQTLGGTNCVQLTWLALCKKPARRRPFECNFRAAKQGLRDAPPPRVTLSCPATCWILLLQ